MITGATGCGKTAIFRIIFGLWPLYSGNITSLTPDQLFYVPERPYLVMGDLKDQIVYPQSSSNVEDNQKVLKVLDAVGYEVSSEDELKLVMDWYDKRWIYLCGIIQWIACF
jgi:ABC-type uncharacterized transport system fused permease/ATPase subunit